MTYCKLGMFLSGSGDIPTAKVLREVYVPKIAKERCSELKKSLANQKVVIMCDETTDRKGRCIFIILLRILTGTGEQRVFVGSVKELENANGTECSRAILSTVTENEIKYEDIVAVVSDSARYMTKCMESLAVIFCEHMVHIQCWAHKLNIVASLWSTALPELNVCVQNAKHAFLNTRKRKHRYISFLKEKYPDGRKKPTLFPSPVMTRWNSWYHAVEYIAEYLEDLVDFFQETDDGGNATEYFHTLSASESSVVMCSATFLVEHCSSLIESIVELEGSSYSISHKLSSMLADLESNFLLVSRGTFGEKTTASISKLQSQVKQCAVKEKLKNLGLKCHSKLQSLREKDTARNFFSSLGKLFGVRNIMNNDVDEKLYASVQNLPLLNTLTQQEFLLGYVAFQKQVASILEEGRVTDVIQVLQGLRPEHDNFVSMAVSVLWIPPSNVDSERAFSSYGHILTDLRTGLKPSNIELMLAKYFGAAV